jgi:predicted metal-dependent phosphoesterase TrpH
MTSRPAQPPPGSTRTLLTASDGTLSPADLVRAAAGAGLDVVAITDHDTTAGWEPALRALPPGLTLVRGAEISCRWYGQEPPVPLHLLAYLFDPDEPELVAELARVRAAREERAASGSWRCCGPTRST